MVTVIPIAQSDSKHLESFVKALTYFGPYPDDSALILPTPEMASQPQVSKLIEKITHSFGGRKGDTESGRAMVQVLPNNLTKGWPIGPNMHFEYAVHYMSEYFPSEIWMWMETDCIPTQHFWLKSLKDAYQMAAVPYMGVLEDTYEKRTYTGGRVEMVPMGRHMAGNGFYPPNYSKRLGPSGAPNTTWKTQNRVYPFTILGQDEHKPVHHTHLLCHKPRTVNWRVVDGQVHCDDDPSKDANDVKRKGVVDLRGVVMVHGCKDDSLADLAISGELDAITGAKPHAPIPVRQAAPVTTKVEVTEQPQQPTITPMPETIEGIVVQWVREVNAQWLAQSGHTDPTIFEDQLVSALEVAKRHFVSTPDSLRETFPQRGLVDAQLRAGSVQLGALANRLKMDKEELKETLIKNGYSFNGKAMWVKPPPMG
jgi:hypothetical protein